MDVKMTLLRRSNIESERQIFTDAIHAPKTYSNKKKKFNATLNMDASSIEDLPGNFLPPNSLLDKQKQSAIVVERWLESLPGDRMPLEDIDPNISNVRRSRRIDKSFNNNVDIENVFKICSQTKCKISPTKKLSSVRKQPLRTSKTKSRKRKSLKKNDITDYTEEHIEEVISLHETNSNHDSREHSIVIDDASEIVTDKDQLACLQVLKAEPCKTDERWSKTRLMDCLQHNIDELRVEISKLEPQVRKDPIFRPEKQTFLWTHYALLHTLNYEHEKIELHIVNKSDEKMITDNEHMDLKVEEDKKKIQNRLSRPIMKRKKPKPKKYTRSIGIQVDTPCVCSITLPDKSTNKQDVFIARGEGISNCKSNDCIEIHTINSENTENMNLKPESDACDSSAHSAPGSHMVSVQFHATMDSLDTDSDSENKFSTPLKIATEINVSQHTPRRLDYDESPPFWEKNYQTPTRGSPTFTLTPPSNSSSNKENRKPNTTPPKQTKDDKKNKSDHTKPVARRQLQVVFEAPPAKVNVACSYLQPAQIMMVKYLCDQMGWKYSEQFSEDVTHLVIGTDDENRAQRTVKYVCGVAGGCWVVSWLWVDQCIQQQVHLTENEFEVYDSSSEEGPRKSRMASQKLFAGFTFCCLPSVKSIRQDILCWIIEAAGGKTVKVSQLMGSAILGPIVVLHETKDDAEQECYKAAEEWKVPTAMLNYEWVVESVSRYRLVPPDWYLLPSNQRPDSAHQSTNTNTQLEWLFELCQTNNSLCSLTD